VWVEDDGTWVMYFFTWDAAGYVAPGKIGRATAPAPTGPWTPANSPMLELGPEESWDGYALRDFSIIPTDEGYVMYYTGIDSFFGTYMIGRATSPDGLIWTKYDDPATTEPPFAESEPVFRPGEPGAWDGKHVLDPGVQRTPDGWIMLYSSVESPTRHGIKQIGYAVSRDGLHWTRAEANPLLAERDDIGRATKLLYHDGTYYLYFGSFGPKRGGTGWNTSLATTD
jgi:hypothetical protein